MARCKSVRTSSAFTANFHSWPTRMEGSKERYLLGMCVCPWRGQEATKRLVLVRGIDRNPRGDLVGG